MNDVARSDGLPYLEQARAFRPRIDREGIRVLRDCALVRKIHDALRLRAPRRQRRSAPRMQVLRRMTAASHTNRDARRPPSVLRFRAQCASNR